MIARTTYFSFLLTALAAIPALAANYSVVTTQQVATVAGATEVEYSWRFRDYGSSGVELVSVSPQLVGQQTLPGYIIADNNILAVTRIGNGALAGFNTLTEVTLSDQTLELGDYVFSNCTTLAKISLGNSLRQIGKRPFVNTRLADVTLPDSLLQMDGNVAAGTPYGTTITISDSSHFCYSEDGNLLMNRDQTRLYACATRAEGEVTLPETLTEIKADAFFGCFRLTNIVIDASVTTIGSKAFNVNGIWPSLSADESKAKLVSVTYKGLPPTNVASDIYEGAPATLVNYVTEENLANWPTTWMGHPVQKEPETPVTPEEEGAHTKTVGSVTWTYKVEGGLATIRKAELSTAGSVSIPAQFDGTPVVRLHNSPYSGIFTEPEKVTDVSVPASVTNIGDSAFYSCSSLSSVDLSATTALETIERRAFEGCSMLTLMALPDSVRVIGAEAFRSCSSLTDIILPAKLDSLGASAFSGCSSLQSVEMPTDLTYIDRSTFSSCSALAAITLPSNLKVIAQYAFSNCSSLKKLTVPASVETLGAYSFSGCSDLTEVTFDGGIPTGLRNSRLLDHITNVNCPVALADTYKGWMKDNGYTCTINNMGEPERELKTDGTWYYHIVDGYAELWCTNGAGEHVCALVNPQTSGSLELPATLGDYLVKSIAPLALSNLRGIKSVSFAADSSYESIGDFAFSNCTSLASITIPYGIRYIGNRPFVNTIIQEISLPDSLLDMYGNVAAGALFDTTISIGTSSHFVKADDGCLYNRDMTRLYCCPGCAEETVTLPESLTEIMPDAFYGCFRLTNLEIPAAVTTIGSKAFNVSGIWRDIPALESEPRLIAVTYKGLPPANVEADVYDGTPVELTSYASLNEWKTLLPEWKGRALVVDTSIGSEGKEVMDGITWFYSVSGKFATVTGMDEGSADVTTLTIPDKLGGCYVTKIGDCAFEDNLSIEHIVFPARCLEFGSTPFSGTYLEELEIPKTLKYLNGNPMAGCEWLQSVSVAEGNPYFSADEDGCCLFDRKQTILRGCLPNADSIVLPSTLTEIAPTAFSGCFWLESIEANCNEPKADDSIFDGNPYVTVYADASVYNWGSPAPTSWKGRPFVNTAKVIGGSPWTDANGNVWTFSVADDVATILSVKSENGAPLQSVTLPAIVSERWPVCHIGASALANHVLLKSVSIPSTYASVGDYAFSNCTSLASITIPSCVRTIGKAPFVGSGIVSLSIPNTVSAIDGNPLAGCIYATTISVDESNPFFAAADNLLFDKAQTTLLACVPSATEVTLPETLTAIAKDAFAGCSALKTVTALCEVPTADDAIFADTPASLVVKADTEVLPSWKPFVGSSWKGRAFVDLYEPAEPEVPQYTDTNGNTWLYMVNEGIATITNVVRKDGAPITTLTLPSTVSDKYVVKHIGPKALANLTALTDITIPVTYESIGDYAFSNCTSLASITIPSCVRTIGKAPFVGSGIVSLSIPNTVSAIGGNPLAGCIYATTISVVGSNPFFAAADNLLFDKAQTSLLACVPSATEVTLPETLTAIAKDAFAGCSALKAVTALCEVPTADDTIFADTPASLVVKADTGTLTSWQSVGTTWKGRSFEDLHISGYTDDKGNVWSVSVSGTAATIEGVKLASGVIQTSLQVPAIVNNAPVTAIADGAFAGCRSLETVSLPDGLLSIGKAPFSGTNLKSLQIPYTVESIDGNPLVGCRYAKSIEVDADNLFFTASDGLLFDKAQTTLLACVPSATEVTLPETLTAIAKDAFAGCSALKAVTALCEVPTADDTIFADTPDTLVVRADTFVLTSWASVGDSWKGRMFDDLYENAYTDANGNTWDFTVEGQEATIVSVTLAEDIVQTSLEVPVKIKGLFVTAIDDGVFASCRSLETISLPDGLLSIGKAPFYGTNLKSLQIPYTVETIDGNPLVGCRYAKSVVVDADNLFFTASDGLLFDKAQTTLLACVPSTTEVTLPETLTAIAKDAFAGCSVLKTVTALCEVPAADDSIFADTPTSLVVKADTGTLTSWASVGTTWKGRSFDDLYETVYTDGKGNVWEFTVNGHEATIVSVTLAEDIVQTALEVPVKIKGLFVTAIDDGAFAGLTSIESVTLPDGLLSLGKAPFAGSNLKSLVIPYTLETMDGNPLVGCRYAKAIEVADDNRFFAVSDGFLFDKEKTTLLACVPSTTEVTLPETLTAIAKDAFAGCSALRTVTALCDKPAADDAIYADTPATLVTLADAYAFDWGDPIPLVWKGRSFANVGTPVPEGPQTYTDDNQVEWTYTVTADRKIEIGTTQRAIPTASSGNISIPKSIDVEGLGSLPVVTVGSLAFADCMEITSLSIPASVTSIQPGAFNGCTKLASLTVASGNTAYRASSTTGALYSKDGTTLVKVPGAFAFKTVYTTTETTTAVSIDKHVIYKMDDNGLLREYSTTIVTNKTPSTTSKTSMSTVNPPVDSSLLFANVTYIADYAFCDCGFAVSTEPATAATTNSAGAVYYQEDLHGVIPQTVTTVTTKTAAEVPLPEIPASVGYSKLAFYGSVWYDQVPADKLPALGESASSTEIANALLAATDTRLSANIKSADDYNDFRVWATSVKGVSGRPAGQSAVMQSDVAWTAFALDLDALPSTKPTSEDVRIDECSVIDGTSEFKLLVSIDGLDVGSNASAERLKTVFNIAGATSLDPAAFSTDNVNLTFGMPVGGKVPVSVEPATAETSSFFMKAGLK